MVRVTGLGSLPGTDFPAAARLVLDALPELVPFPELPARGPHAALVGRSLALLDGVDAELGADGWRLAAAPGPDLRRARATWRDDLERFEEAAQGYEGRVKVAVAGPWTLAASVLLPRGGRVLGDHGARRDVAQSLALGVARLRADVERRLGADVVVQVDEPSLPAVLAGGVPTEGGYFRHRRVGRREVGDLLREVTGSAARADDVVHCCAPGLPVDMMVGASGAGFAGVSVDQDTLTPADWDDLAGAVDAGATLYLGCVPTASGGPAPPADALTRRVLRALEPLGPGPELAARLVLTPACGLAGWTPRDAAAVWPTLTAVATRIAEQLGR